MTTPSSAAQEALGLLAIDPDDISSLMRWVEHAMQARKALRALVEEHQQLRAQLTRNTVVLKLACDRNWTDETPAQVVSVASNALYWRGQEIEKLKQRADALQAELDKCRQEYRGDMRLLRLERDALLARLADACSGERAAQFEVSALIARIEGLRKCDICGTALTCHKHPF